MKHRLAVLAAVVAVAFSAGCGMIGSAAAGDVPAGGSSAAAQPTTQQPAHSAKDSGDLPDPCTLLTGNEVANLTARAVTRIDEDGADSGDSARYCQWQQNGGQLAVFLSRTTADDFRVTVAEAQWVDGVGQDAYWHSGHLFVRYGTVQLDVYSSGASDERNRDDARNIAKVLIPRI